MPNTFTRQLSFSLQNRKDLPEDVRTGIKIRIEALQKGAAVTAEDILNASVWLDLPFSSLIRRIVLDSDEISSSKALTACLESGDLSKAVFIASECIVRIDDDFYFINAAGKADLSQPVPEELLEKTRRMFLRNALPIAAGRISSPKSFFKAGRLSEDEAISQETLLTYLFGRSIPDFDKTNAAFFNTLAEEDKKCLLQWLIGEYRALEDLEMQTYFDDPESVTIKTSDEDDGPLYSVLYFPDDLDFLETDLPEKAELMEVLNKLREKARSL